MAQQLYFSRDTRMFVQFRDTTTNTEADATRGGGSLWEIPVLDGYSFSQATNTSEIALSEMESSAGVSRRGRRMFTDSLAPAEWSFSTYARPFASVGQTALGTAADGVKGAEPGTTLEVHAVEEVLWASMFGADKYDANKFVRNVQPVSGSESDVITPDTVKSTIVITESNRSALHSFVLYFLIDTATSNPLLYRMPEAIVNEVSIDFDVDGIATLNWTGFAKEIQDNSEKLGVSSTHTATVSGGRVGGGNLVVGVLIIDTGNSRAVHIATNVGSSTATTTQAIDEAITSTENFIRNRLTGVTIETADAADKVTGTFPGAYATISAVDNTNKVFTTSDAHGFASGDQVYITGCTGNVVPNSTHLYVRVGDQTGTYLGTTNATTEFALFDSYAEAINLGNATGLHSATYTGTYNANTGVVANGKYSLTMTGGSFNIGNNISYLVPEELGAINKPLEHVTGTRTATGTATCYLTLEDTDSSNGTSRQFFNDLVGTGAMAKVVNKFKVDMHVGGTAATANTTDPALKITFPTAHIEVPSHSVEDVISLETNFTALPTDFGAANEITSLEYRPPATY